MPSNCKLIIISSFAAVGLAFSVGSCIAENSALQVSTKELVDSPNQFLNKTVSFSAKFFSFGNIGLDYRPAFRSSKDHLNFIVSPDNSKNPLSELKLFIATPTNAQKNRLLECLKEGASIHLTGTVFSTVLDDPWVDVTDLSVMDQQGQEIPPKFIFSANTIGGLLSAPQSLPRQSATGAASATESAVNDLASQQRIRAAAEKIAADLRAKRQKEQEEARKLAEQMVATEERLQPKQADAACHEQQANAVGQALGINSTDRPIRDKWAVVVGIGKFADETIPKLQYPAKDARDFYEFLTKKANFPRDHVRLLLDEKATQRRIESEIGDTFLPRVVGPDDLVLVYFATHGTPAEKDVRGESYLSAYDTEKTQLWASGIDMKKLLAVLQDRVRADRILIVLDACHSGAADPNARAFDFQSSIDVEKFSIGRGNIILASSKPNETSWESSQYHNGIFTKRLIDCLSANPNILKAFPALKNSVADDVQHEFGKIQTPHLKADGWEGKDLLITAPCTGSAPLPAVVKAKLQPDSSVLAPAAQAPIKPQHK